MSDLLPLVQAPTLVLLARRDVSPLVEGRALAAASVTTCPTCSKLGVWSRAQAIVFARDRGFQG